jgi:hypothetical protein
MTKWSFVKAEDVTPEAFLRQALRTNLFKPLQVNANLPLSCLIPLSNIIKLKKIGGDLSNYLMFVVFRIGHVIIYCHWHRFFRQRLSC